jgi:hypothetical protein
VIQVGQGPVRMELVRDGEWEGVAIHRDGVRDRTIFFNAAPGEKLPRSALPVAALIHDRSILKRFRDRHVVQIR